MKFFRPLAIKFAPAVLVCAAVWPLQAADTIEFSKPTDNVADRANSFMGQPSRQLPGGVGPQASSFARKPQADFDVLPGYRPPRPLSPEEIRQMREKADRQNNWMLMTPEEILNVPTAEKILGLTDPDQGLTAVERYFKRQDRERNFNATNGAARLRNVWAADSTEENVLPGGRDKKQTASGFTPQDAGRLGMTPLQVEQEARRAASPWGGVFEAPPPPAKPDAEQQASMARFRALLDSGPVLDAPETSKPGAEPAPVASRQPPPSLFEKPEPKPTFNPAGNSYTPVHDTSFRPIAVAPLSSPFSPQARPVNVQPAKPLTESPPWLKDDGKPAAPAANPVNFPKRKI